MAQADCWCCCCRCHSFFGQIQPLLSAAPQQARCAILGQAAAAECGGGLKRLADPRCGTRARVRARAELGGSNRCGGPHEVQAEASATCCEPECERGEHSDRHTTATAAAIITCDSARSSKPLSDCVAATSGQRCCCSTASRFASSRSSNTRRRSLPSVHSFRSCPACCCCCCCYSSVCCCSFSLDGCGLIDHLCVIHPASAAPTAFLGRSCPRFTFSHITCGRDNSCCIFPEGQWHSHCGCFFCCCHCCFCVYNSSEESDRSTHSKGAICRASSCRCGCTSCCSCSRTCFSFCACNDCSKT